MNNKSNPTLYLFIFLEVVFFATCIALAGINYFIGNGLFRIDGIFYAFLVCQIPVVVITVRFWLKNKKSNYL